MPCERHLLLAPNVRRRSSSGALDCRISHRRAFDPASSASTSPRSFLVLNIIKSIIYVLRNDLHLATPSPNSQRQQKEVASFFEYIVI